MDFSNNSLLPLLPVEIKHISRLTWNDLPGIEIPFFARDTIGRDCSVNAPFGFFRIFGLGEALRDYARWYSPYGSQTELHDAIDWLLDQVERGEYVLIHKNSNWIAPMDSALRWSTEDNPNGYHVTRPGAKAIDYPEGRWTAASGLPMFMRLQIEECLGKARRSDTPTNREPEREWWGGLLEGKRWRGEKRPITRQQSSPQPRGNVSVHPRFSQDV
ncbi:MAG: hypothetical protein FWG26_09065 [Betaproteobacteria bacterium]|jgi:hypothetical protein|nr:hypothetical protein [Betaproteobacteria bacterium]